MTKLLVLFFLLVATTAAQAATLYPYGATNGDTALPRADDASTVVPFPPEHPIWGYFQGPTQVYVNNNGILSVRNDFPTVRGGPVSAWDSQAFPLTLGTLIAPFWADVDTRVGGGQIWYRVEGSGQRRWIVTWDGVATYPNSAPTTVLNTFQVMVQSLDDGRLFVEFRYPAGGINWLRGTASTVDPGVGFDLGDGVNFHNLVGSRTAAMMNLPTTSNTVPADPGVIQLFMPNRAPLLRSVSALAVPVGAGRSITTSNIRFYDGGAPSSLTYTVTTAPTLGVILRNGVPVPQGGTFTQADLLSGSVVYLNNGTAGADSVAVTLTDGGGLSTPATLSINVSGAPSAAFPVIAAIAAQTTNEDTAATVNFTVSDDTTPVASIAVQGSSSDPALVPHSGVVVSGNTGARTATITPVPDGNGTVTIRLIARDQDGNVTSRQFPLAITPVNDAPAATPEGATEQTIAEDGTASFDFTVTDVDTLAGGITAAWSTNNAALFPAGSVVFSGDDVNRTLNAMPAANVHGTGTITLVLNDGAADSAPVTFTVTVTPVNDAPTISTISNVTTNEDTATGALDFTVADVDSPLAGLTLSGTSSDTAVVAATGITFGGANGARTITVTPEPSISGSSTITVRVTDDGGLFAETSFTLTVDAVNDAPVISTIMNAATNEDTATGAIPFTVADIDSAVGTLLLTGTSSNSALVAPTGITFGGSDGSRTITLTPVANAFGTSVITVRVTDGGGLFAETAFTLTVNAVNDLPTITAVANQTLDEDGATSALDFTVGDVETPAANLSVTGTSDNTTLLPAGSIVLAGAGAARTVTITPAANQSGSAVVTLTVDDGTMGSTPTSFTVTVNAVNDLPTISTVGNQTTNEDTPVTAAFVVGDIETAADALTVSATSSDTTLFPAGSIALAGDTGDRTVTLTPAANLSGEATITLTVQDGAGATRTSSFSVTVTPVNDPPAIAGLTAQTTNEDVATGDIPFTVTDLESAAGVLTVTATSSDQAIVADADISLGGADADRTVQVGVEPNATGNVTITLRVHDPDGGTTVQTFVLTVAPVNDLPTLAGLQDVTVDEDSSATAQPFTVGDVETAADALTVTATSSNQALLADANITLEGTGADRSISLLPTPNANGSATITVRVTDVDGGFSEETFTLNVTALDDAPFIAQVDDQQTAEDVPLNDVVLLIGDLDTDPDTLVVTAVSSDQAILPDGNLTLGGTGTMRTISMAPAAHTFGTVDVTVTVADATSSVVMTFRLDVMAVNDAPTVTAVEAVTTDEDLPTDALAFSIGDVETAADDLTITVTASDDTLVPSSSVQLAGTGTDRTITITPAPDVSGESTVTISVSDGTDSVATTFLLTVNAVNDTPVAANDAYQVDEDGSLVVEALTGVLANDLDVELDALTVSVRTDVQHGVLMLTADGAFTYTPAGDFSGTDTFTYVANDGALDSAEATVTITVNALGDPPVAAAQSLTTAEDTPLMITFSATDPDGDMLTWQVGMEPQQGTLSGTPPDVVYTPAANVHGMDALTFIVSDGTSTDTGTISITVTPVNDAPVLGAMPDGVVDALVGTEVSFTITATDVDGTTPTLAVSGAPMGASFDAPTGAFQWTPALGDVGDHMVTLEASDGELTDSRTIVIRVTATDSDGDGLADVAELMLMTNPDNADSDGDGLDDLLEVGSVADPRNTDEDDTIDALDSDSDNDTISDADEAGDADLTTPPLNSDDDELPNAVDTDSDNDGIPDADEAGDADLSTPPLNSDSDDTPDFLDSDSDNDGADDGTDNCRTMENAGQEDSDNDGVGDACDTPEGSSSSSGGGGSSGEGSSSGGGGSSGEGSSSGMGGGTSSGGTGGGSTSGGVVNSSSYTVGGTSGHGSSDDGGGGTEPAGCGCEVSDTSPAPVALGWLLMLAVLGLRRRR